MAEVQHTLSGAGAPSAAPPSIGAHYTDTLTGDQYQAHGTNGPEDWGPSLVRQGYAEFSGEGGTFTMQPWHSIVEVFGTGTVLVGTPFNLQLPAVPVGASRAVDVISWSIHESNHLIFRGHGAEALAWARFIGQEPDGAVFENGELKVPMSHDYALRAYLIRLATPEVPAGELGLTVAVLSASQAPIG
ncbi:hypothetical protein EQ836_23850 [Ectopseudomonas mendocina]|uniref:DUF3237 domain-containing protein n=1 Tax=Ectopseudomonas mendocina TaxID=300 RepID=A0ABD7RR66_ECTME|nr:hypothetical protein [Pseudomonas mendocina]TRO10162.1 hypothetical protein EQ829_21955 [Pseudomonas mendocina]TRO11731.1 hypothetical protein EQ836_23850 [Pseudomonas mendocina]